MQSYYTRSRRISQLQWSKNLLETVLNFVGHFSVFLQECPKTSVFSFYLTFTKSVCRVIAFGFVAISGVKKHICSRLSNFEGFIEYYFRI